MALRCFHNIDGHKAAELLNDLGEEGTFLVRPSAKDGDFVLSVKRNGTVTHVKIQNGGDHFDLYGGEEFASLLELVQYYMQNPDKLKETSGAPIPLIRPLSAPVLITDRWFHGRITGLEAQKLLQQEHVKNGSFLVRESYSQLGSYSISVRLESGKHDSSVTHVRILCKDNKYDAGGGEQFYSLSDLIEHHRRSPLVEQSGNVIHLKYPFNTTRMIAMDIADRVRILNEGSSDRDDGMGGRGGFWEEFESLQHQESKFLYTRKEGQKTENAAKNRYKNILPFDHSRIRLKGSNSAGSDYINANLIEILKDYEEFDGLDLSYIATQGCLPNTVDDFWRMVWSENSRIIVMTTKEVERGKVKCTRYWPDANSVLKTGLNKALTVTNMDEYMTNDYALRKLSITHSENQEIRTVYHYQFLAWPDHGVPENSGHVLTFLDAVSKCRDLIWHNVIAAETNQSPKSSHLSPYSAHLRTVSPGCSGHSGDSSSANSPATCLPPSNGSLPNSSPVSQSGHRSHDQRPSTAHSSNTQTPGASNHPLSPVQTLHTSSSKCSSQPSGLNPGHHSSGDAAKPVTAYSTPSSTSPVAPLFAQNRVNTTVTNSLTTPGGHSGQPLEHHSDPHATFPSGLLGATPSVGPHFPFPQQVTVPPELRDGLKKLIGPTIVHCSAGIGRTGTFIVIDLIINQLKLQGLECAIDIQRSVQMIRSQRSGMVQTAAQYKFVYMAVRDFVEITLQRKREENKLKSQQIGREYTNIEYSPEMVGLPSAGSPNLSQLRTIPGFNSGHLCGYTQSLSAMKMPIELDPPPIPKRPVKKE